MKPVSFRSGRFAAIRCLGLIVLLLLSGACRLFSPEEPLSVPAAPTPASLLPPTLAPTAVSSAEAPLTAAPPISTPTRASSLAPTSAPPQPALAAATPTHPDTLRLKIFLVAIGDNGQSGTLIGCGDSIVPVHIDVPYTQGVLRAALERLLSVKQQFYGESGLYNALYQSDLGITGLKIEDGTAIIQLSGQAVLGGECDPPRLIAQIEATAQQFSTVQRVSVFLNGESIRSALSSR